MMNEHAQPAPVAAPSGDTPGGEQGDGSPDPSPRQSGPTIFQRVAGLLRPRNGSSLREDLTDALSETTAEEFSPAERAMLKNILRLREVRVEQFLGLVPGMAVGEQAGAAPGEGDDDEHAEQDAQAQRVGLHRGAPDGASGIR